MGGGYPELLSVLQQLQWAVSRFTVKIPICIYLHVNGCDRHQLMSFDVIASRWSRYSGDNLYPVPVPASLASIANARSCFHEAQHTGNFWSGEYGDNRKALLAWAIHYLEEANSGKIITYGPDGWEFRVPEVNDGKVEPVVSRNEGLSFLVDGTPIIYRKKEP